MSPLDSWTKGEHSYGTTHPTYRKGSGPGVIVIHEIPGLTPKVVGFGQEVVDAEFTVVLPQLFGAPGAPATVANIAKVLPRLCVSRELTCLATGETTPVAAWLRSLARELRDERGDAFLKVEFPGRKHSPPPEPAAYFTQETGSSPTAHDG